MRRLITLISVSLALLTLAAGAPPAPGAEAARPTQVEFTLAGSTYDYGEQTVRPPGSDTPSYVKLVGMKVSGKVSGAFTGDFNYTENAGAAVNAGKASTKGDLTLTITEGPAAGSTVEIKFMGVDQLVMQGGQIVGVIVEDQPWVFKGGTGAYEGIHGNGKRSTFVGCGADNNTCVTYTGQMQ